MTLFPFENRHDYDFLTDACVKCGGLRHAIHESDSPLRCLGGGNVVGVTHRALRRRFGELLATQTAGSPTRPPAGFPEAHRGLLSSELFDGLSEIEGLEPSGGG